MKFRLPRKCKKLIQAPRAGRWRRNDDPTWRKKRQIDRQARRWLRWTQSESAREFWRGVFS